MASILNATTSSGLVTSADNSGSLQLATNNGTTAVTIDTSQKVGIGTTSPDSNSVVTISGATPNSKLRLAGGTSQNGLTFAGAGGGNQFYIYSQSDGLVTYDDTAGAERMRITSSGQALFGATSLLGSRNSQVGININGKDDALFIQNYGSGIGWGVTMRPSSSSSGGNGDCFNFTNTSFTTVGTIATSSSATAYNTSSDYRLKENISPMTGALATVAQLKPVTYKWKADGKDGQGFIAHELQSVVPEAVTGEKDAIDKDGNPRYQGVDASFLVATLTSAIQELNAKVDAQALEIQALKGVA